DVAKGYVPNQIALDDAPQGKGRVLSFVRPAGKEGFGPATLIVERENGARAMAVLESTPDIDLGDVIVELIAGEKRHTAAIL
ncbi:MAG: hypothetical protein ACK4ZE_12090, partial [Sphingorhabdus sp.]